MRVKLLTDTAMAPTRGSDGAVGYDFYSDEAVRLPTAQSTVSLYQNESSLIGDLEPSTVRIKTGCAIELPRGHVGLLKTRSSYAKRGVIVTGGVIDPDYRGEVLVCLENLNDFLVEIPKGSKIAQMLIIPCWRGQVGQVSDLSETQRGSGGFGSTGN